MPLPHGILSGCTDVIDVTDPHELLGTDWQDGSCADAHPFTWCTDESPGLPAEKEFARPLTCTAEPVTIYAGVECNPVGRPYREAVRHAREALRMGEQRALEQWMQSELLCPLASLGNDLTPPAGAVTIAQGVAALEGWLGENYGGLGVLHVPAGAAAVLGCCNVVHLEGGSARTLMGNCVVMGSGYGINVGPPDCLPADAGEAWLYVTGPIRVRREGAFTVPDTDAQSVRILSNDRFVLAERTFVVELACCQAAAIRVTVCP
ncbi:cupin [Streptomyces sp. NPDC047070]|uniref:cupin n=1 Tax=Streptomyces sp. NPDC047070 TaxID=3154923 RepID=UPI003453E86B